MNEKEYFEGVRSYTLLAKKEVGQNFLINPSTAKAIVDALAVQEGESVLEIGFGAGSLTYFLSKTKGKVEGIDIDEAMVAKLQKDFSYSDNLTLHQGNAMRFDYSSYDKIVGNLPYYITSGILENVLLGASKAKRAVFMIQKEASDRIFAKPGNKDYGPLSILFSLSGKAKRILFVPRSDFSPPPHIDSVVFAFDFNENRGDLKKAYILVGKLFLNRRKTIFNNLKNIVKEGEIAKNILELHGISLNQRPEELTPEQYLALSQDELILGRI